MKFSNLYTKWIRILADKFKNVIFTAQKIDNKLKKILQ